MADSIQSKSNVVLLYPGESLTRQVAAWMETHPGHALQVSWASSHHDICTVLSDAAGVLLDGTKNPQLTAVAFSQAVAQLGSHCVAVYTEKTCHWLELHVRMCRAIMLLGPMDELMWDELFALILGSGKREQLLGPMRLRPNSDPNPQVGSGISQAIMAWPEHY